MDLNVFECDLRVEITAIAYFIEAASKAVMSKIIWSCAAAASAMYSGIATTNVSFNPSSTAKNRIFKVWHSTLDKIIKLEWILRCYILLLPEMKFCSFTAHTFKIVLTRESRMKVPRNFIFGWNWIWKKQCVIFNIKSKWLK